MRPSASLALLPLVVLLSATAAQAASLRLTPVLIEVGNTNRTAVVTLRNEGPAPITIQNRIFRWGQSRSKEELEPTRAVVASPPITTLAPGAEGVIRIVRIAPQPVNSEESYRLIVDQLPVRRMASTGTIHMLVRHSVPVFFSAATVSPPPVLKWSVSRGPKGYEVAATNGGQVRVRISDVEMDGADKVQLLRAPGLVGYVLPKSTMRWQFAASRLRSSGPVNIHFQTEAGPLHARATIAP